MEGQLAVHQEPKGPRPAPAAIVDCLPTRKYGKQPTCGKGKAKEDVVEECYVCLAGELTLIRIDTLGGRYKSRGAAFRQQLSSDTELCTSQRGEIS